MSCCYSWLTKLTLAACVLSCDCACLTLITLLLFIFKLPFITLVPSVFNKLHVLVSTYFLLLPSVALVGSATLITLLPFIPRPFDTSKRKVYCHHISYQPHLCHYCHYCHNLVSTTWLNFWGNRLSMSIFLSVMSFICLKVHHHIVFYSGHKWSYYQHPICYDFQISTIGCRHFFSVCCVSKCLLDSIII